MTAPQANCSRETGLQSAAVRSQPSQKKNTLCKLAFLELLRDSFTELKFPTDDAEPQIEVLCLGLGSPTSSRDSRAQLAFLIHICKTFSIVRGLLPHRFSSSRGSSQSRRRVSLYDPKFTEDDVSLMTDLELRCLTENKACVLDRARARSPTPTHSLTSVPSSQHGKYPTRTHSIVFMPHCSDRLNENVLRSNWTRGQLGNMLLIANHFGDYIDRCRTSHFYPPFITPPSFCFHITPELTDTHIFAT